MTGTSIIMPTVQSSMTGNTEPNRPITSASARLEKPDAAINEA